MEYLDFDLEIGEGTGREYPVKVVRSPAGEGRETMVFPFDKVALQIRLQALEIALLRSGGKRRKALSQEEQTVQEFGRELFCSLIHGEILSRFDVSRREAQQQGKGLRLRLRLQTPQLAALPWEFLYDHRRGEYLCLSKNTPTVRYLELPEPIPKLKVAPPLRILGMVASPKDLPLLDVEREKQRIEIAVQTLKEKGFLQLTWLAGQTWEDLQQAMWVGPWHIFHFIGHGGFDRATDEGLLALADAKGEKDLLSATQIASLLADHHFLRLVLLNACEGAKGSDLDIYSSTAAVLVRRGIAAVLAMQYEITDDAAVKFAEVFYKALAYGLPVDAAVSSARVAVNIAVNNTLEWGTPVLYSRAPDGVLFDLTTLPAEPPVTEIQEHLPPVIEPETPGLQKIHLWVRTEPSEARLTLLNVPEPFIQGMALEPGKYELEVSASGYETKKEWVELKGGQDQHVNISLTKFKNHLWIATDPGNALIKILTPPLEFKQGMELEPGKYEIEVSAADYETKREWVELEGGTEHHLKVALTKIMARLWVETEPQEALITFLNIQADFLQGIELEAGKYHLEISAAGCESQREWVDLDSGEDKHLTVILKKEKAHLWLNLEPQDATVKVLDLQADFTQGMELEPDSYAIEISSPGFETKKEHVDLGAGEEKYCSFKLAKVAGPRGRLFVEIEPQEAGVAFLNIQGDFTQGMELGPGSYHVEVSAAGCETKREWFEMGAGEDKHLSFKLTSELPAKTARKTPKPKLTRPEAMKSRLYVDAKPQEAKIKFLNFQTGFVQGMELEPGDYHLEVSAAGYHTKHEWFYLEAGDAQHVSIALTKIEPLRNKGRLWVDTEPQTAKVWLYSDRRLNLIAFTQGMELVPGRYELEVAAVGGYETQNTLLDLGAGEDKHINIKLIEDPTERILRILRSETGEGYYVVPGIPAQKESNARKTCGVPAGEKVLALVDTTFFGSAKDGVVFGERALYFHNIFESCGKLDYADFPKRRFELSGKYQVDLGGGKLCSVSIGLDRDKFLQLLNQIGVLFSRS